MLLDLILKLIEKDKLCIIQRDEAEAKLAACEAERDKAIADLKLYLDLFEPSGN